MIDFDELSRELEGSRCRVIREDRLLSLSTITGSIYQLLCAAEESVHEGAVWPSGLSFWVHEGTGNRIPWPWSGLLYYVPDAKKVVSMCGRLCSERSRTEAGPLTTVPHTVIEAYKLQEVEELVLGVPEARVLDDALIAAKAFPLSQEEFLQRGSRKRLIA